MKMRRLGHKQKKSKTTLYSVTEKHPDVVWEMPFCWDSFIYRVPRLGPSSIQATSGKADSTHHPTVSLLSDSEAFPLKNSGHLPPAGTKQVPQSGLTCAFAIFQRKRNEHLHKPIISRASGQTLHLSTEGWV